MGTCSGPPQSRKRVRTRRKSCVRGDKVSRATKRIMKTRVTNKKKHHGKTQPAGSCHRVSHPRKTLEEDEKMDRFGDNYLNLLGGRVLPDAACLASSCLEVERVEGSPLTSRKIQPKGVLISESRGGTLDPCCQPGYQRPQDYQK